MDPPAGRYGAPLYKKHFSASQAPPSTSEPRRLSKWERKSRYDRIETLTKQLKDALKDEMGRRKHSWDVDGDREEEAQWEVRKGEIYAGLEDLVEDITRAFRDRSKEAVLDLWEKESEDRRVQRGGNPRHTSKARESEM